MVTHDWQIPDMIMRDLRRGYTYDHECNVIKIDDDLAKARLAFLVRITGDELAREKARRYLHQLKEIENVFIISEYTDSFLWQSSRSKSRLYR